MDQAGTLRKMAATEKRDGTGGRYMPGPSARGIAVASGKGGVGKTNIVGNLAFALAGMGKRVLLFDADVGLGNIHILLGLVPKFTLQHVLEGKRSIEEVLVKGPGGITILPASSGGKNYSELSNEEKIVLKGELEYLENRYDYIFFDIGAGISKNVIYFCTIVQEVVIVCSSEPTSFADAYAIMKVLSRDHSKRDFRLIVNMVKSENEGLDIFNKLSRVADRFRLDISIDYLGHIFQDDKVTLAVREQRLFLDRHPRSPASRCIQSIAKDMSISKPAALSLGNVL